MKDLNNFQYFLIGLIVFIIYSNSDSLYAQKAKKNRARINVQYVKIMDGEIYFDLKASSRVKKETILLSNIELTVYNELDDKKIELGKIITNEKGESRFKLESLDLIQPDSTNTYHVQFIFKGNDSFKKAKKSIDFKDANIIAKVIKKDSIHYVTAKLIDIDTESPIIDESLTVQVQRLFKPLRIGEEFNNTDEEGIISIPIEKGIPGIDGELTFEVVLNESDDYGTVKALVTSPVGIPIVDESTFDQRTMWSSRNKTPIFLLIFPNLLIVGTWGFIIYLIINLFKLSRS